MLQLTQVACGVRLVTPIKEICWVSLTFCQHPFLLLGKERYCQWQLIVQPRNTTSQDEGDDLKKRAFLSTV